VDEPPHTKTQKKAPARAHSVTPDADAEGGPRAAEEVRRQEVSRVLGRMDFSPEEGKALERMSRSLVDGLLRGPISEAMRCAGDQQRPTAPRRGR
jgi:glutamyl-tRNA reductase